MANNPPKELICATPDCCRHPQCWCEARPHEYRPDAVFMGDCAVCGHVRDSLIHTIPTLMEKEDSLLGKED